MPSSRHTTIVSLLLIALLIASLADKVDAQKQTAKQSTTDEQTTEKKSGAKKAIAASHKLEADTLAFFSKAGDVVKEEKVDPKRWDNLKNFASKICDGPEPISPRCVRCKDGEIICAYVPSKEH
jgi:hypothetical protein